MGPNMFGNYFDGTNDEIRIFNRALSDSEITGLYNNCNQNTFASESTTRNIVSENQESEDSSLGYFAEEDIQLKVFPNPFQNKTTIKYFLPERGNVNLELRDFLGRKIKSLENHTQKPAGKHQLQLDATNLQSGTYFLTLNHNGQIRTKKLILLQ